MMLESKIKIVLTLLVLLFFQFSKCQTSKLNSKCDAINKFLTSEEVKNRFKKLNFGGDTIIIIDYSNDLSECKISKWIGMPVSVITAGPILDSIKKFTSNHVIGLRRNIFVFAIYRENNKAKSFNILNGTTNLLSIGTVKEKRNRFYLGKIENGVQ